MEDFDTKGDFVVAFIEHFLTLGGSFAGQPFLVMDWMKEAIREIFRLRPDGKRAYRTFLLGVPRKNAKSILGAALAIYMLTMDESDSNPVIISAAGDKDQARLVFDEAKRMVLASPELSSICKVYRNEIHCPSTGGIYKVISADSGGAHGLNPSFVIVDEYHVHKNPDLYVALTTGSGARQQPMMLVISTAGWDLDSPLGKIYQYGRKVESGEIDDAAFGFIWHGPREGEEFDPSDPEIWERFNPSWEILNHEEMESAYRHTPESEFIRYRLNGWTSSQESWFPTGAWDGRKDTSKSLKPNDLIVVGFDGAWKGDSTALVGVRIEDLHIEVLGHWEAPPGDQHWRTPVFEVEQAIRDVCSTYSVREVAADPYRFEQSLTTLAEEGLPIVEWKSNSLALMVPATQAFYDGVMDAELTHNGDPALARHIANCTLKIDARGARITKDHKASTKHIDIAVASVIAYQRAKLWRDEEISEAQLLVL